MKNWYDLSHPSPRLGSFDSFSFRRQKSRRNRQGIPVNITMNIKESSRSATNSTSESGTAEEDRTLRTTRRRSDRLRLSFIIHGADETKIEEKQKDEPSQSKSQRGRQRCIAPGCSKIAKSQRKCNTHGGGKLCSFSGCTNFSVSYGKCITHGVIDFGVDALYLLSLTLVGWKTLLC